MSATASYALPSTKIKPRTLRLQERALLAGFLLLPTFDFKGSAPGGNAAQMLLAIITIGCGLLFSIQRGTLPASRPLQIVSIVWWSFLTLNLLSTLIGVAAGLSDASFDTYSRAVLPYILFGVSLSVVQTLVRKGTGVQALINPMVVAAMVSVPYHFVYARVGLGVETDQLRYQAITPFLTPIVAAVFTNLFLQSRLAKMLTVVGIMTFGTILLSITRSYLLVIAAMIPAMLYALRKQPFVTAREKFRRVGLVSFVLVVMGTAAVLTVLAIRPNTLQTWSDRLFRPPSMRFDPSILARQMNSSGIQMELKRSAYTMAVGKGFGGGFLPDMRFAPEYLTVAREVPTDPIYIGMDSRIMNSLLFTGILGSIVQLILYIGIFLYAVRGVRYQSADPKSIGAWSSWPMICLVGLIPTIVAYDIFTIRGESQIFGIISALALAAGDGRFTPMALPNARPESAG